MTTSTAIETSPRAISGPKGWRLVFAGTQRSQTLWSLPLDLNGGRALGEPRKLFPDGLERTTPSLSADGSRLSYVYHDLEGYGVRVRDTKTGTETTLVQAPNDMRARLSPDGSTVAYTPNIIETEKVVFLVSATGGDARKFCDMCGLIYDWTPDGRKILYRTGNPMRFSAIEVATGRQTQIVAHPKFGIYGVVPSPDQSWLAVYYGGVDAPQGLFIAPVAENGAAKPQSEWITLAERGQALRPWWSPDGNVLYYVYAPKGQLEMWARRLDPKTKQPRGEAFLLYSPPAQRSLGTGHPFGPATSTRQLIFPMFESTGNVWLAE